MRKLLIILSLFPILCLSNPIDDNCPDKVIWGAPKSIDGDNQYLCRNGYAVNYSYKTKTPFYVVEHISKNNLIGNVKRQNNFHEDFEIPDNYRSKLSDYPGTDYDRGHLAPAADFEYSKEAMDESFLMSNMMPQNKSLNRGTWAYLESYVRDLVHDGDVYVITGTIYTKNYKTIGNVVGVPDSVYKIIIQPSLKKIIVYKFPNSEVDLKDFRKYLVTVKSIEKLTGLDISPLIPKDLAKQETVKTK